MSYIFFKFYILCYTYFFHVFFSCSANQLFVLFFCLSSYTASELRYVKNVSLLSCLFLMPRYPHLRPFPFKEASFTAHRRPTSLCLRICCLNYIFLPIGFVCIYQSCIFFCGIYFLRTTLVERTLLMFALSHGFQYLQNMNSQ